MITPEQLKRIETGFGMNEPARLVALALGLENDTVQTVYCQLGKGVDIYRLRGFAKEKRPPRVDAAAVQRFEESAKTALAALEDLRDELAPLLDGELHTSEALSHVKKARAAIADARASVRLRRVLSGELEVAKSAASASAGSRVIG